MIRPTTDPYGRLAWRVDNDQVARFRDAVIIAFWRLISRTAS